MKNKAVKLLLYCTKAKPNLMDFNLDRKHFNIDYGGQVLNGKIVAEAECDLVEEIFCDMLDNGVGTDIYYYTDNDTDIEELACLDINDLATYLPQKRGGEKVGYAIHLKNVNPFEQPKKLSEYYHWRTERKAIRSLQFTYPSQNSRTAKNYIRITSAPQNMCYADEIIVYPTYVETNFTGYEEYYEHCVLISFKPQELCKILNGYKTIEVRKSILNALKEMIKNNGTNINVVSAYCR